MEPTYEIVRVLWSDSHSISGWVDKETAYEFAQDKEPCLITSIGFRISQDGASCTVICQSIGEDQMGDIINIPNECIRETTKLGEFTDTSP